MTTASPMAWPGPDWEFDAPANHGIDPAALTEIDRQVTVGLPQVRSFLVVRDGVLVHERYFRGASAGDRRNIASVNKSMISALAGVLLARKLLTGVDQKVTEILGDLCPPDTDPQIGRLAIRHLLTMTSGFYYPRLAADSQPIWDRTQRSDHWVRFSLGLPIRDAMGTGFRYKNTDALLMAAVLVRVTGLPVGALARDLLFDPIGMRSAVWQQDDPQGMGPGVFSMNARDMARFGYLYLAGGSWNGRQVLPEAWVRESTRHQTDHYGYFWWVFPDGFAASGAGGQLIRVIPAKGLVVVFQAEVRKQNKDPGPLIDRFLVPSTS